MGVCTKNWVQQDLKVDQPCIPWGVVQFRFSSCFSVILAVKFFVHAPSILETGDTDIEKSNKELPLMCMSEWAWHGSLSRRTCPKSGQVIQFTVYVPSLLINYVYAMSRRVEGRGMYPAWYRMRSVETQCIQSKNTIVGDFPGFLLRCYFCAKPRIAVFLVSGGYRRELLWLSSMAHQLLSQLQEISCILIHWFGHSWC